MAPLTQILALLLLAAVSVALLGRLRLPPIVSYVVLGAVAGPHALGWLQESETIHLLGELGIAFLLFTLGLEFSLRDFAAMRRLLLIVGGAQVAIGTLFGAGIAWMLGMPWAAALIVGGAISMSSTAIVVKQLRDQRELQTPHGRLALGILLFQDLAAIPFLVVIPILAQTSGAAAALPLAIALAKAIGVAAVMLVIGRYALRPLLHEAGASAELFTMTALLVALASAWVTELIGLSPTFGAFLAGMMLSETEYRHQIENEIRPFRDVLLALFFIVVGMQLQPGALVSQWGLLALLILGIVAGKGVLIAALARAYGYRAAEALRTGIVLAQGGEFSVALIALAMGSGLFTRGASQAVLAAVIVSMLVAPLLIRKSGALVGALIAPDGAESESLQGELAQALQGMSGHVLICGYGRVGRQLARILRAENVPYVALDIDPGRVKRAWEAGDKVYYGDAAHRGMLRAAAIDKARAVVVSFDHLQSSFKVVREVRAIETSVPVIVRATDDSALDALLDAGASEVVPETLEESLMLATQLLLVIGTPGARVMEHIQGIRMERYHLLRDASLAEPAESQVERWR
jgi:CPA2 family monovalent cation:H+ antiporter-2